MIEAESGLFISGEMKLLVGAYAGLFFSVLVWGSNFIAGDWLVEHLNPVFVAMTRLLFSSVFLIGSLLVMHRYVKITRKQLILLLGSGVVGTLINQSCFFSAEKYIAPTESALIMSLAPVATAIFAFFFLREKITLKIFIGSVIAILGVFLLVFQGTQIRLNVGDLFSFVAMLSFSGNMILVRKLARDMDSNSITVYGTLLGTFLFVPTALGSQGLPHYPHMALFWVVCALSAIMSQGLCGLLINNAITKIGATQVAVVSNLQPFISMVVGYFTLSLPITEMQILGGIIIVMGVLFTTVKFHKKTVLRSIAR